MNIRKILREELEKHSFNINKYTSFSSLTKQDLVDIAIWGLEGSYSTSGCWDDAENLQEAVQRALEDFYHYLKTPYPEELGNIPQLPIIYRFVTLENEEDLDKSNLGVSWFSDLSKPEDGEFFAMLEYLTRERPDNEGLYLLTGQTSVSNIDIPSTLWERSVQWAENEIVIKNPNQVKLLKVDLYEEANDN